MNWRHFVPADFEYEDASMTAYGEQRLLSEDEIDELVTAQADDDSAWEEPITVQRVHQERIDFEDAAFADLKRNLAAMARD